MKEFKNKKLLITGGTGSFGNAVLKKFLKSNLSEIRILSRDEKKQDDMRKKYHNEKLKFYLGDVREPNSLVSAIRGVDYIFHAAALKQVPSCEFFPLEAVKTNIIGTENVLETAINHGVKKVVCLSTDKAVYPINAMGISKALMEKVIIAKSRTSENTKICITRYGNVMASRGSVIPLFINQILKDEPITITNPNMTRFMMTLESAVDLVLFAFRECNSGDIFVQKAPGATIELLAECLKNALGKPNHKVEMIGIRHGEKVSEALMSKEEVVASLDMGDYFRIPPDMRDLNYQKFIEKGSLKVSEVEEYTSHNTTRLDKKRLNVLLKQLNFFKAFNNGQLIDPEES
tara:strand:- start:7654 stop:8691 length:1038 start_codon:yes stop_codon:yes gene_type:complete